MNRPVWLHGHLFWDILAIYREILDALGKVAARGQPVRSLGIDTWGVDFGLVAADGTLIGNPYAYRDPRTEGAPERVFQKLAWERLYEITGIQLMNLNSLFQLYVMVEEGHPWLRIAHRLLFLPDLLNYFLTGRAVSEITIASTSQMLDARKRKWSAEIFEALGLPQEIMACFCLLMVILFILNAFFAKDPQQFHIRFVYSFLFIWILVITTATLIAFGCITPFDLLLARLEEDSLLDRMISVILVFEVMLIVLIPVALVIWRKVSKTGQVTKSEN